MIPEFLHINRGDKGAAPHKPLLLLTIIELVEQGIVKENRFEPNAVFKNIFKSLAAELVGSRKTPVVPELPFYYLKNDGFWQHNLNYGQEIRFTKSGSPSGWSAISESVSHASLATEIFEKLKDAEIRASVKRLLLLTYFPDKYKQSSLIPTQEKDYMSEMEHDFFTFKIAEGLPSYNSVLRLERDSYFHTKLPFYYKYSCAISRAYASWNSRQGLVESCHIIPLREKSINSIQNGILLSPTLHRAFDHHLISISAEYKVMVSKNFLENSSSSFNLSQFEGVSLLLPAKKEWYPSQEALEWHRGRLL